MKFSYVFSSLSRLTCTQLMPSPGSSRCSSLVSQLCQDRYDEPWTIHRSATSSTCNNFVKKLWVRLNSLIQSASKSVFIVQQPVGYALFIANETLTQSQTTCLYTACMQSGIETCSLWLCQYVEGRKMCKFCAWSCLGSRGALRALKRAKHGVTRNPKTTATSHLLRRNFCQLAWQSYVLAVSLWQPFLFPQLLG